MTQTPVDVPEKLFLRLTEEFSEAQLVELTAAIAWENYRARFDHAFGIETEGFSEGSIAYVPRSVLYALGEAEARNKGVAGEELGSFATFEGDRLCHRLSAA